MPEFLIAAGQAAVLSDVKSDEAKEAIIAQLKVADSAYPGGLKNYCDRARKLLADSKNGVNPFEGYTPEKPESLDLAVGSAEFFKYEELGMNNLHKLCFVLVAGGLGERLGYPDIKVKLPTEVVTHTSYLEWYMSCILHLQTVAREKTGQTSLTLPLAIMTSADTHERTLTFLEANDYFGLNKIQVSMLLQDKVPALLNNEADIAVEDGAVVMKPHGHGDVHTLLHQSGLAKKWHDAGHAYVFFFQDTNALCFRSLAVFLGSSIDKELTMNSLCVPRPPKDNVGGICRLVNSTTGSEMTLNVEYNQLDSLLKSAGLEGDVAESSTGYSAFPGNCNILLFGLNAYVHALQQSNGAVPEFVNPKYADADKSTFKSPTRLECMMQDFARNFQGAGHKVGATVLPAWFCFSTVKNSVIDAIKKLEAGASPESAFTAEAQFYSNNVRCFEIAACKAGIKADFAKPKKQTFAQLSYDLGPRLCIHPSFGLFVTELVDKLKKMTPPPTSITMHEESTLVIGGAEVQFTSLWINGYIVLSAGKQYGEVISTNGRLFFEAVDTDDASVPPMYRIRGYKPIQA